MLMDKSGLRKGKPQEEKKKKGSFKSRPHKKMTPQEEHDNAVQMALKYGVGYNQYKKEVDAINAQRLRDRIENNGIEIKEK